MKDITKERHETSINVGMSYETKEKVKLVASHFRGVSLAHAIRILIEDKWGELRKLIEQPEGGD